MLAIGRVHTVGLNPIRFPKKQIHYRAIEFSKEKEATKNIGRGGDGGENRKSEETRDC